MHKVSCPSCGATVEFQSPASVMAVCGYCKSTVLKDADAVKNLGRMADVLEDYSPIQIGTSGRWAAQEFTVVGRIQLRYEAGLWNEWFVFFSDGRSGWLSDDGGQFVLTFEKDVGDTRLPAFEDLRPGENHPLFGNSYMVVEARQARCTGGEGELPFVVGDGWQAKLADLRQGRSFATLDYSEQDTPRVYAGQAVTLAQLQCQLLRDDDAVKDTAGKVKGRASALLCPSCSSSVRFVPGTSRRLVCPSCRSAVDVSGKTAVVLDAADRLEHAEQLISALKLGAKATISGAIYETIGVQRRSSDDGDMWNEYLLYSPRQGFLWLVETEEGWTSGRALDVWPRWLGGDVAVLDGKSFEQQLQYTARVGFVAGAFNWKVQTGDTARVLEFAYGKQSLVAEITKEEINWTLMKPVPSDQLRAWFGSALQTSKLAKKTPLTKIAEYFLYGLAALNFIPWIFRDETLWYGVFAGVSIYFPAWLLNAMDEEA